MTIPGVKNKQKMKRFFIDTSVFLRFLLNDDSKKYEDCTKIFSYIGSGKIMPYISTTVISEILYVLIKTYKFDKKLVLEDINKILKLRNLVVKEKTKLSKALSIFEKNSIKFGDCLIITEIPKGVSLLTYDGEYKKVKTIKSFTPTEFLSKYYIDKNIS